MKTRCWPFVVISSSSLFILCASQIIPTNIYTAFAMWQFYFVLGLLIAKIRVPAISWFYSLPKAAAGRISALILVAAGTSVVISALLAFNLYPTVDRLTNSGWLPSKFRGAYFHLLHNQSSINLLLRDDRMGILRPLASLLILGAGYIIYQKYKQPILKWTGNFVNAMGRDTLWIFAAQAVIIPVMAALPIPRNQFIINSIMTLSLVYVMWLVTKRRVILVSFKRYSYQLYRSGITAVRYANSVFTGNEKEFQPSDDL